MNPFTLCVSYCCLVSLSHADRALAQNVSYFPDKVGVWRPWKIGLDDRMGFKLTSQEVGVYSRKLQKLAVVIHQAECFNPPKGVDVQASGAISTEFLDDGALLGIVVVDRGDLTLHALNLCKLPLDRA